MSHWILRYSPDTVSDHQAYCDRIWREVPSCGTVACIGGSIAVLNKLSPSSRWMRVEAAGQAIGLTPDEADGLFGSLTATIGGTATVTEGDVLTASPVTITAAEGTAFTGAVATFSDTLTSSPASDFTATINWGDGTTTAGTVAGGSGSFTVSGSHTYGDDGSFSLQVTLADNSPGTASAIANSTAVSEPGQVGSQ